MSSALQSLSDCLKVSEACLLMQIALVCDQEVQRILKLEQGVEVVVAKKDGQLARLQTLRHSSKTLQYQAPDYNQTAHPHAQLHNHEVQHVMLHAHCYHW